MGPDLLRTGASAQSPVRTLRISSVPLRVSVLHPPAIDTGEPWD